MCRRFSNSSAQNSAPPIKMIVSGGMDMNRPPSGAEFGQALGELEELMLLAHLILIQWTI